MEAFQKYNGQAFDPKKHIFALTSEIMLQLVSDGVKIVIREKFQQKLVSCFCSFRKKINDGIVDFK